MFADNSVAHYFASASGQSRIPAAKGANGRHDAPPHAACSASSPSRELRRFWSQSAVICSSSPASDVPSRRASLSSSAFLWEETRQLYTSVFMHYSVVHLGVLAQGGISGDLAGAPIRPHR